MSTSMTPVVLVSLPNLPYLLGTFDTTNFRQWWRSAPFPDDLEEIKKGFHIYGRSHLAIAKRKDGRWAIYRSKNYGIDWERVFLAAAGETIYDLVLITFGRAIMNTSLGFYETVNAGTSWSLVLGLPSAPNAPAFCNIGGGDVLMCTDGRYIWRSTNIARAWTQVCDMHAVGHLPTLHNYYTGLSIPTIAGACGRVLAANGPFLVRSDDGGLTWHYVAYWETYAGATGSPPPHEIIYNRLYTNPPGFLINQITVSSVDGVTGDDVCFLIKIDDIYPVAGTNTLFSRLFVTYTAGVYKNNYFKPIFQQYLTPSNGKQQVSCYDVPVTGANYNDRLAFSAQTRTDPVTGKSIPSLKYSADGGATWYDVDLNATQIGDPSNGGNYGGSIVDDNFAKLTWVAPACNNQGAYNFVELSRRQCQSYEMDAGVEKKNTKSYQIGGTLVAHHTKSQNIDVITEATPAKPYNIDALAEGQVSKIYQIDRTLEGLVTKSHDLDAICVAGIPVNDWLDVLMWANIRKYYHLDAMLNGKIAKPYLVDAILVKDRLNEKLSTIEREMVQFLDIDVPGIPYAPLDSRQETL